MNGGMLNAVAAASATYSICPDGKPDTFPFTLEYGFMELIVATAPALVT